jgi:hypothetical protein
LKSRIFVGSSIEALDTAYALQENLERDAEVTVWTQGIFDLSSQSLQALVDALDEFDFGVFVLTPDDVVKIKGAEHSVARDNVVFELGLFIGRLGRERCYIVAPRGSEDFHLPTDLLGVTAATYEPSRQDHNLIAALGPACNRIRKALERFGPVSKVTPAQPPPDSQTNDLDEKDCISILESWMGSRPSGDNMQVMHFEDVDRKLNLPKGTAEKYLAVAARRWDYVVARLGKKTILLKDS